MLFPLFSFLLNLATVSLLPERNRVRFLEGQKAVTGLKKNRKGREKEE